MWSEDQLKWYDKVNRARPTHTSHGLNDGELEDHLIPVKPTTWRLEGNQLIGDTEYGPITQHIPTDYILTGTDENGLPILQKIVLQ